MEKSEKKGRRTLRSMAAAAAASSIDAIGAEALVEESTDTASENEDENLHDPVFEDPRVIEDPEPAVYDIPVLEEGDTASFASDLYVVEDCDEFVARIGKQHPKSVNWTKDEAVQVDEGKSKEAIELRRKFEDLSLEMALLKVRTGWPKWSWESFC